MRVEEFLHFFVIPVIIGIIGASSAYIFRYLVKVFTTIFIDMDIFHSDYFYLLSMPLLFFVSNFLIAKLLIDHSNVTIDNVAKRISLMVGKFSHIKGFLVLLLSSVSIGLGAPIGREGPIAKLGGLGSELFLKIIKVQRINLPIYLSAGVSSAIAATFNAPVAGIIFGIEIIIGKINSYIIIPLIISCATATLLSRDWIGDFAAFYVPHLVFSDKYLLFVPIEAVFFSIVCLVLSYSLKKFITFRTKYKNRWHYITIAMGFVVGLVVILTPEARGVGYEYVSKIFENGYTGGESFLIMLSKLLGTVLSIGSGIFGGLMSPGIFIGAFGGYWLGSEFLQFGVDPKVFALIGSAAMLSGISRAPLRGSIIITELTHSYQLLLPILIASSITGYILSKFESGSYFKRSLVQKGIDLDNEIVSNYFENCDLTKFMENISALTPDTTIRTIMKIFKKLHVRYLPVAENGILIGIVSLRDVRKKYFLHKIKLSAKDIMSVNPFAIKEEYSKEDIFKALSALDVNYIPYVSKNNEYIGMININKLLKDLSFTEERYKIKTLTSAFD